MRAAPGRSPLVLTLIGFLCLLATPKPAAAQRLSARAAVGKTDVYLGESFQFQVQIQGHDAPEKPNVSAITDFAVEEQGGSQNSSSSVTIINGQVTRQVRRGYIFSYRLTPKRVGALLIPSIKVNVGGQVLATQPVRIRAVKPAETDEFKLRMELSAQECYVGQPITLTVTWYVGRQVRRWEFSMPVLSHAHLDTADLDVPIDPSQRDSYLQVPLGKDRVIAKKGRGTLDGKGYTTVRFKKVLIPKAPGTITIPQSTVVCDAVVRYRRQRFVVPSNEPTLTVRELPADARPVDFSGPVGQYALLASATPTEVRVGDPITLTIQVSGPDYLENVKLPSLHEQPALARGFKIPEDRSPGKVEGSIKTFTQTIRAKHADVTEIPPIEFPYFDATKGEYAIARSEPIPLKVEATRIVTARDAEGRAAAEETKTELKTWAEGIAHNYEDLSVLHDQAHGPGVWVESPVWMSILGCPPLLYVILLVSVSIVRARRADPEGQQARRAYRELAKALHAAKASGPGQVHASVLEAFRRYLGSKLRVPSGALTYNDVEEALHAQDVGSDYLVELKALFERCEATRYAGATVEAEAPATVVASARELAKGLERALR